MLNEISLFQRKLLLGFSAILIISIAIAIIFENPLILAVPLILIGGAIIFLDFSLIFYALIFSIPISIHLTFGSLALDVASEPLMIVLLAIFPFLFLTQFKSFTF